MKKAEEYIENIDSYLVEEVLYQFPLVRVKFLEIIKQAQIDAIDATVKRCAESAKITIINQEYLKQAALSNQYSLSNLGCVISKQSILQVADKLKKELE